MRSDEPIAAEASSDSLGWMWVKSGRAEKTAQQTRAMVALKTSKTVVFGLCHWKYVRRFSKQVFLLVLGEHPTKMGELHIQHQAIT